MKRSVEKSDLRGLAAEDLANKISSMQEELMKLNFRKSSGQLASGVPMRNLRRRIARAKTVQREARAQA